MRSVMRLLVAVLALVSLLAVAAFWLVQQRREELAKLAPEIWLPGLFLTAVASPGPR